jgi:Raf kinase inhibitor-like YbhB/YbcL family protein
MASRTKLSRKTPSPSKGRSRARSADLGLKSPSFGPNESIPVRHTADGENLSPALTWEKPPEGTRALALLCEDPDAPLPKPFVHWLLANIDPEQSSRMLSEGVRLIPGGVAGKNSFGQPGYGGPEPPRGHGTHHYHFRLFALDAPLSLREGFSKEDLLGAMKDRVIGSSELIGTYRR